MPDAVDDQLQMMYLVRLRARTDGVSMKEALKRVCKERGEKWKFTPQAMRRMRYAENRAKKHTNARTTAKVYAPAKQPATPANGEAVAAST